MLLFRQLGGYVGPSWGEVGPCRGEVGPSWGYVGPSWGYVGPSWNYVGPAWGYVGPSWGYVGPSWGLCWPILELCWPILGLCWPILAAMLAHLGAYVGPSSVKSRKRKKHCKTRYFRGVGGRGCTPLSPSEKEMPTAKPRPVGATRAPGRI